MSIARKKTPKKPAKLTLNKHKTNVDDWTIPSSWKMHPLIIFGIVATAVVVALVVIHFANILSDENRFRWAQQKMSNAGSQMSELTNQKVTTSWENYCFKLTNRKLFDKSYYCTTELKGTYTVTSQLQYERIAEKFDQLGSSRKVFGSVYINSQAGLSQDNLPSMDLNCGGYLVQNYAGVANGAKTTVPFYFMCDSNTNVNLYPGVQ